MRIKVSVIAGVLFLASAGASAEDFDTAVLEGSRNISVAAKESGVNARLNEAVVLRQQVRRYLIAHGGRLTKEQIGSAKGEISGSILSFGGSFRQEQYDVMVKGGEFFIMAILSSEAKSLIGEIRAKRDSNAPVGVCVLALYDRLEPLQQHAVDPAEVSEVKGALKRYQALLDGLELKLQRVPESDARKQQFKELTDWGRGSMVRVVNVSAKAYQLKPAGFFSNAPTGAMVLEFENPGATSWVKGCEMDSSDSHVETLLKYNFNVKAEDIPVY